MITDEMVEAGAEAYWLEVYVRLHEDRKWPDDVIGGSSELFRIGVRAALEAVSALASPPAPVVPEGWKTIDGAPTHAVGSFSQACLIGYTKWGKEGRVYEHVGPIVWQGSDHGWEFSEIDFDVFPSPTHWMPLPAAPLPPGDAK